MAVHGTFSFPIVLPRAHPQIFVLCITMHGMNYLRTIEHALEITKPISSPVGSARFYQNLAATALSA